MVTVEYSRVVERTIHFGVEYEIDHYVRPKEVNLVISQKELVPAILALVPHLSVHSYILIIEIASKYRLIIADVSWSCQRVVVSHPWPNGVIQIGRGSNRFRSFLPA
jgi:hypothetical protein